MNNPYASPTSDSAEQPKKRRFGLPLLFVFLLMFGGCALSVLFLGVSKTTVMPVPVIAPAPIPVPAQPTVSDTPTELPAEQPTP